MQLYPENQLIADRIYDAWKTEKESNFKGFREHLGASIIGQPCSRALWYSFRWVAYPNFDGRMYRLFDRGDIEEDRFVKDLRAIGAEVVTIDPETGTQYSFRIPQGHFGGSMDGAGRNFPGRGTAWHVLEFKTHSDNSYAKLYANGVEQAKYEHFCQMQIYMGLTGMQRALYCAANKNDDQLYFETVKYNEELFTALVRKAEIIIFGMGIPGKIAQSADSAYCKYCDFKNICHHNAPVLQNCRTCRHSQPKPDGRWYCTFDFFPKYAIEQKVNIAMTKEEQIHGCEEWEIKPELHHEQSQH